MFGLTKRRKEEKQQADENRQRMADAVSILIDAQNDYDEKTNSFGDPVFVAAMIAEAKKVLYSCALPRQVCSCNNSGECKTKWPKKSFFEEGTDAIRN